MGGTAHSASVGIQSAWEKREYVRDPEATFPGTSFPIVTHQSEECTARSSNYWGHHSACSDAAEEALLAAPRRDLWRALFLKLLANTT